MPRLGVLPHNPNSHYHVMLMEVQGSGWLQRPPGTPAKRNGGMAAQIPVSSGPGGTLRARGEVAGGPGGARAKGLGESGTRPGGLPGTAWGGRGEQGREACCGTEQAYSFCFVDPSSFAAAATAQLRCHPSLPPTASARLKLSGCAGLGNSRPRRWRAAGSILLYCPCPLRATALMQMHRTETVERWLITRTGPHEPALPKQRRSRQQGRCEPKRQREAGGKGKPGRSDKPVPSEQAKLGHAMPRLHSTLLRAGAEASGIGYASVRFGVTATAQTEGMRGGGGGGLFYAMN